MKGVAGVLIVLRAVSGCNSSTQLTDRELLVKILREDTGPFDELDGQLILSRSTTLILEDFERGERIRENIDKSLKLAGIKHETSPEVEKISGIGPFYFSDTPDERVELYLSYINTESDRTKIFITRKLISQ